MDKKKTYKKRSIWIDVWLRLRKNKSAIIGFIMFAVIAISCFTAPLYLNYESDIISVNARNKLQLPSSEQKLGTDELGRDLLYRIIWGGKISLTVGIGALLIALFIGAILGVASGYYGGNVDMIIMRMMDIIMAIPTILLMITLASIMERTTINLAFVIGISIAPGEARTIRGQVLKIKNSEYIEASRVLGASDLRIILTHILPNAIGPIITTILMDVGICITLISSLSFIGLGIAPPDPEWGSILSSGRGYLRSAWNISTFPGIALMLTIISLTLMGDGLRDAMDPKMKR